MIAIAVIVFALAVRVRGVPNCQGAGYDLSALAGPNFESAQPDYTYIMSVCGATVDPSCKGGSLCQYEATRPLVWKYTLSTWDNSGVWSKCTDPVNCPNGGVTVSFANGDICTSHRAVEYIFACAPNVTTLTFTVAQTNTPCVYTNVIQHEIGCYIPPSSSSGGGGGGAGGASSTGSDNSTPSHGSSSTALGVGLGIGLPVAALCVGLLIYFVWYKPRGSDKHLLLLHDHESGINSAPILPADVAAAGNPNPRMDDVAAAAPDVVAVEVSEPQRSGPVSPPAADDNSARSSAPPAEAVVSSAPDDLEEEK